MSIFFDRASLGFWHEGVHGARHVDRVDDGQLTRLLTQAARKDHEEREALRAAAATPEEALAIGVNHRQAAVLADPPMQRVANPACEIPVDADLVEITEEEWRALIDGQSTTVDIGLGADGRPALVDAPGPSHEQAMARLRTHRDAVLRESDALLLPDRGLSAKQTELALAWRRQLREAPGSFAKALKGMADPLPNSFTTTQWLPPSLLAEKE